jgi:3-phenylpropionate/trans-cinnamate dioxygenase ferredoxin component
VTTRLCALDEVPTDSALRVELADIDVAVVRVGDEVFAIEDVCSHADFPLSDGEVSSDGVGGCTIECALHGSRFDLRTGKPSGPPATAPVTVFSVTVADGDVYIEQEL